MIQYHSDSQHRDYKQNNIRRPPETGESQKYILSVNITRKSLSFLLDISILKRLQQERNRLKGKDFLFTATQISLDLNTYQDTVRLILSHPES